MGLDLSSGAPWQRVTAAATLLLLVLVRCTSGLDAAADYSKATTLELALAAAEAITKDWESGRVDYSRPGPHDRRGDEDEDDDEDDDDLGVESAHNFYRPPDDYCFQCDDGRYTNWIHPELFTAAANGDKEAMSIIGRIYMTREEMRDRFFYTDEASRGIDQPPSGTAFDEGATRAFGMPTGEGIQDTRPSAALKWYARAAEREHAFARGQVGGLFMQGARGIAKNLERARTNLEMAVELGDVYAMHWLGVRMGVSPLLPRPLTPPQRSSTRTTSLRTPKACMCTYPCACLAHITAAVPLSRMPGPERAAQRDPSAGVVDPGGGEGAPADRRWEPRERGGRPAGA